MKGEKVMRRNKGLALVLAASMALNLCGTGGIKADAANTISGQSQKAAIEQELQEKKMDSEDMSEELSKEEKKLLQEKEEEKARIEKLAKELKKSEKKRSHSKKASEAEARISSMSELVQEDGTFLEAGKDSQITISSGEELRYLSEYTKAGMNTKGVTFTQTDDIDCKGATMSAIGTYVLTGELDEWGDEETESRSFQGVYDGCESRKIQFFCCIIWSYQ